MSTTRRTIDCPPEAVFDVLSDGWLYGSWVVGASRIRDVDDGWPALGTRIHHSVGAWPMLIDDTTSVLEVLPPTRLKLRARAWPTGEAEVLIEIKATAGGSEVSITEDVAAGPGRFLPKGLRDAALDRRNRETLLRLDMLVVGRNTTRPSTAEPPAPTD